MEGRMNADGTSMTAPPLSVRDPGPGVVTVGGLTAGGCALLLFVNEDCPTSAMAMRRLGPLRPAAAGGPPAPLAAAGGGGAPPPPAVFEAPLEVAAGRAPRPGGAGGAAPGAPPYETSRAYGLVSVPTAVLVDDAGTIAGSVTGW